MITYSGHIFDDGKSKYRTYGHAGSSLVDTISVTKRLDTKIVLNLNRSVVSAKNHFALSTLYYY